MNSKFNKMSVLCFLGMGAIAYGQQTDPYKGRVGINTKTPQATMQVKATEANLAGTTNEGIMAPQLSKTRVAAITTPVEGTLVYVTNETTSPITAYTGADLKVAKIDEKGYYFYNGTEWVKVGAEDTNDAEWVYDSTTNRINLKRSGSGDFANSVYYDSKGGYNNLDATSYPAYILSTDSESTVDMNQLGYNKTIKLSKNIERVSNVAGTAHFKRLGMDVLVVDADETTTGTRYYGKETLITTSLTDSKNHDQVYGNASGVSLSGSGTVANAIGALATNRIIKSAISDYTASTVTDTYLYTPNKVRRSHGLLSRSFLYGSGEVTNLSGSDFQLNFKAGTTSTVTSATSSFASADFDPKSNATITNLYGFRYSGLKNLANSSSTVTSAYGVYVGDVSGATKDSYAIYTNAGNVRIGDLKGTGSRPVYANADGVLTAGGSTTNIALGGTNGIECNEANRGVMNFVKDVTLSDGSKADAFAVCLKSDDGFAWRYLYGTAGVTNHSGTFGTGL